MLLVFVVESIDYGFSMRLPAFVRYNLLAELLEGFAVILDIGLFGDSDEVDRTILYFMVCCRLACW